MKDINDSFNLRYLSVNNNLRQDYLLSESNISHSFSKEVEFLTLFRNGDWGSVEFYKKYREKFFQKLAQSKNRCVKNNLIVLVANLTLVAVEAGCNPQEMALLKEKIVREIENRQAPINKEILVEIELKVILLIFRKIKQNKVKGLSKPSLMIVNYVQEHLSQQIALEDLALHCGRHPNYLSALFKRETNKNIQQYILEERIKKAKHLIKHSDNLFVEIAHLCGFESQSYFTVQFKKIVGCTPKEYRKHCI